MSEDQTDSVAYRGLAKEITKMIMTASLVINPYRFRIRSETEVMKKVRIALRNRSFRQVTGAQPVSQNQMAITIATARSTRVRVRFARGSGLRSWRVKAW
jgi:hypothetical protein